MIQGSPEWLEWRRKGIGASDIPIILGLSPYVTRYELYMDKLGHPKKQNTFVANLGAQLEPKARAIYELQYGLTMLQAEFTHPKYEWCRASLDGWNPSDRHVQILELKYVGKDKQDDARKGIVPEIYIPQVQWQLFVTSSTRAHYGSYYDNELIVIEVEADPLLQGELFTEAKRFWQMVEQKIPPALTEKEIKRLKKADKKKREMENDI